MFIWYIKVLSLQISYYINKFTIFFLWQYFYMAKKFKYQKQCLKLSKLHIVPLDALQTVPKHLSNNLITVLPKQSAQVNTKVCLGQLHVEQNVLSVSFMQAVIHTRKFLGKVSIRAKILGSTNWNDSIMADWRFTIEKELEPLNMKLKIPLFLSVRSQMLKDEVTENQDMASLSRKSHKIKKIKKFKVLIKLPSFVMGHIYIPLP